MIFEITRFLESQKIMNIFAGTISFIPFARDYWAQPNVHKKAENVKKC